MMSTARCVRPDRQDEAEAAPSAAPGAVRPGAAARKKTAALPVSEFLDRCAAVAVVPCRSVRMCGVALPWCLCVWCAQPCQAAAACIATATCPCGRCRGVGGAALPRSRQDRKDKEKEKRGRGQSSVSHWKSEAEMVLRCLAALDACPLLDGVCRPLLLQGAISCDHSCGHNPGDGIWLMYCVNAALTARSSAYSMVAEQHILAACRQQYDS
jgi:hypothetical protein